MNELANRVLADCQVIAGMTEEPSRITRRFLTTPVHAVHAYLRARMEALGMQVRVDALGNLRGRWQPAKATEKALLLGSHIDTVPDAGAYDGVLGVALALAWIELAQDLSVNFPMEVVAFSEEEGVRFSVPFLGSRAVAGSFDPALLERKDESGKTLASAIRSFGLAPELWPEAAIEPAKYMAFVEIHMEQGPVLEAEDLPLSAVSAIVGQGRLTLCFTGQANHAGTTPMALRHDALGAAAEWIVQVESLAQRTEALVATVGRILVDPNAGNVVPGSVTASLDLRHADDSVRGACLKTLLDSAAHAAALRKVQLLVEVQMDQPAVAMDSAWTARIVAAMEATGFPARTMTSGAGHDAMILAQALPTTMLFLRTPSGISHHPTETVRAQDVEAALAVGRAFLLGLHGEIQRQGSLDSRRLLA